MAYPVTLNGRTYTLADFEGNNYVDGLPDAFEDFVTHAGDIYNDTSTTSNSIGTGSKTFTVAAGKPYQAGTPLRIADAAAPATNFLDAVVTSYSGTTLVVEAIGYGGSGTLTSWTVNIGGAKTIDGTLGVSQGGTGATTAAAARTNLDTYSKTEADSRFLNVSGEASDVTMTGNVTIGDADTDTFTINAATTTTADISFGDNDKAIFGAGSDLQIYSDGANSIIHETDGTGNLIVKASNINLQNSGGTATLAQFIDGGKSSLRYNNVERLATTSTGVDITGTITSDDAVVAGSETSFQSRVSVTPADNQNRTLTITEQKLTFSAPSSFGTSYDTFISSAPSYLIFGTSNAEKMRIDSSGNVGIGVTNPSNKFQVSDSAGGSIASFTNTTSADLSISLTSGVSLISPSTGILAFGTANTERARFDSSGRFGIGRSSADGVLLDVESSSSGNIYGLRIRNRGQVAGSSVSAIWSLNRDGSDVNFPAASIKAIKEQNWTTTASTVDGAMIFETIENESSSEKMRLSSNGSLMLGTDTLVGHQSGNVNSAVAMYQTGQFAATSNAANDYTVFINKRDNTSGGLVRFRYNGSDVGSITNGASSVSYNTSSDYRLKENVVELTGATDRLKQLEPKRFNFILDADTTVDGFLAHEVQTVVPEATTGAHNEVDDDGNPVYQGIDQSKLVPLLVATIKELEARITALESN